MSALEELEERIRAHIPLTRHLGFRLRRWTPGRLELTAPLEANINDKGTFFAGSQSALLALSGWALTTLEAEAEGGRMDVVAVKSSLRHRAPAPFDALLVATAREQALDSFRRQLRRQARARLSLGVELLGPAEQVATTYEGLFLARSLETNDD